PVSGEFTTLAGGSLDPSATVLRVPTGAAEDIEADVRVEAVDVAITDLLIASIPGDIGPDDIGPGDIDSAGIGPADADQPSLSGRAIARRLRPQGAVHGVAAVRRPPGGPTTVRVGVEVDGAAHPPAIPG